MKKTVFMFKYILLCLLALSCAIIFFACGGNSGEKNEEKENVPSVFSDIVFSDATYVYDGTEKSVVVSGDLPEGVTVTYENNNGTNAGTYNARAILSKDGYDSFSLSARLTIEKANYDMTGVSWDYTAPFTYDGTEKSVAVMGLPEGVTIKSYSNNAKTDAGDYSASVVFNYDTVNYNAVSLNDLSWKIEKANYDMTGVSWDYTAPFTYDGTEKSVAVTGLPEGVTIKSYSNNAKTDAGDYSASAVFNYDTVNYNAVSLNDLSWKIEKANYDMTGVRWSYNKIPFIYNGEEKTVTVTGLPAGVTVKSYIDNVKVDEGRYVAKATLLYDTVNYNTVSVEDCEWFIIPDLVGFADRVVNNMLKVPDPWEFLPESFALENKAYVGDTEIGFTDFVSVSSLPKVAMGKQMNVVYDLLVKVDSALDYLREIYGYINVIIDLYQDYINQNPFDYAEFEKTTDNFDFMIKVSESDYQLYISYKSVALELSFELETEMCYGRIQLADSTAFKYEMSENALTIAVNLVNVAIYKLHFERDDGLVDGYLYEYYGTESKNIKTSALIKIDENYTSVISNKRELEDMDLAVEGNLEVYKNSTGNLIGAEVRETISKVNYETSWFNIYDVVGINTIKVIDEINGKNADTIYINGNVSPIKTKTVGGLSLKSLSRRFDIEMKDVYVYTFNGETGKYEKVKIDMPMLFVQNEFIASFSEDFYNTNKDQGAINPTNITMASVDATYLFGGYDSLIDEYVVIKEQVTYQSIKDYIGGKNEYFE